MGQISAEKRAQIMADVLAGGKYREIATRYQVSVNGVSKMAMRNGVARKKNRPRLLSDAQATALAAEYEAGDVVTAIADRFGVSVDLVLDTVRRTGTCRRTLSEAHARLPLRHDAFDELTPDAAYWLGIIFTDGTVVSGARSSPEIGVVLKTSDRPHLVKLRDFLASGHAITPIAPSYVSLSGGRNTGAFRYTVRSQRLAGRVLALGRYGPAVDPALAASRDFWRGVVDGDGTISISHGMPQCKVVGSRWLLEAYVDFLGPIGRRPLNVRPAQNIFVVSTSGNTTLTVLRRLYAGAATSLDRKAEIAAALLGRLPPGSNWRVHGPTRGRFPPSADDPCPASAGTPVSATHRRASSSDTGGASGGLLSAG